MPVLFNSVCLSMPECCVAGPLCDVILTCVPLFKYALQETNSDSGKKNMDALVLALKEIDGKYSKHSDCMAQVLIKVGFLYCIGLLILLSMHCLHESG